MALKLFTRHATVTPAPETWTPQGTIVVQRYRALEGATVLVYTADSDRGISSFAAACLGCTYRAARNGHGSARLSEADAADLANSHAADCRAINRGAPKAPDDDQAAQMVRSRLWSLRAYGTTSAHYVSLSDTTEPYSSGPGTRFLVQPHPPRG